MADEETVVESKASEEVQAKAEKLGWIPPTRFKGEAARFIDAEEYIERGETVLPIVKKQNEKLTQDVTRLTNDNAVIAAALKQAQTAINEIEERHTVATQKAVEKAKDNLKAELAAASEAGDHAGVADLTSKLVDLGKAEEDAAAKKDTKTVIETKPAFVPSAEMKDWNDANPWFGTNKRKTSLALGIAQELRDGGEASTGRVFFDKVAAEVEKELGGKGEEEQRTDKVEGNRGGAGDNRQQGGGGKKSYASLPADAKAACDADARKFVGPDKKYKTQAEWRGRYAELYFQE